MIDGDVSPGTLVRIVGDKGGFLDAYSFSERRLVGICKDGLDGKLAMIIHAHAPTKRQSKVLCEGNYYNVCNTCLSIVSAP